MPGAIYIYGTQNDMRSYVLLLEKETKFKYSLAGLLDSDETREYNSLIDFSDLGIASADSGTFCKRFLVCYAYKEIEIRQVPQHKGGIKIAIDQLKNPETIIFQPCGELKDKNAIIEGTISTTANSGIGVEIFNIFKKTLRKIFIKYQSVYIGHEAMQLKESGWRLTSGIGSSPELDIK